MRRLDAGDRQLDCRGDLQASLGQRLHPAQLPRPCTTVETLCGHSGGPRARMAVGSDCRAGIRNVAVQTRPAGPTPGRQKRGLAVAKTLRGSWRIIASYVPNSKISWPSFTPSSTPAVVYSTVQ
jgi:hypothetical protein